MDTDAFRELQRDHRELLWLIADLLPGCIHKDVRCRKAPVPHVITVECDHLPEPPAALMLRRRFCYVCGWRWRWWFQRQGCTHPGKARP